MNLIGHTSGRLRVLRRSSVVSQHGYTYWVARCGCGKTVVVRGSAITGRTQKSCGCLKGDQSSIAAKSLALYFLQDMIEPTLDFVDSISADSLAFDLCQFAAAYPGTEAADYPIISDLIYVLGKFDPTVAEMHRVLYGWDFIDSGDIFGVRYKA